MVYPYRTLYFHVYVLDINSEEWVGFDSIGDRAVFVGGSHSRSVLAREFPEFEANSVHFTDDNWDPEKPSEPNGTTEEDDWDPEKPSDPQPASVTADAADDDDWDPEKPSEPTASTTTEPSQPQLNGASETPARNPETSTPVDPNQPPLEWGNDIYKVRFPRQQPHAPGPRSFSASSRLIC